MTLRAYTLISATVLSMLFASCNTIHPRAQETKATTSTRIIDTLGLELGKTYSRYPETATLKASYVKNDREALKDRVHWLEYRSERGIKQFLVVDTYNATQKQFTVRAVLPLEDMQPDERVLGDGCAHLGRKEPNLIVIAPLPDDTTPSVKKPTRAFLYESFSRSLSPVEKSLLPDITCPNPQFGVF